MNDGNLTFVNSLKILNMFVVLFMKYQLYGVRLNYVSFDV